MSELTILALAVSAISITISRGGVFSPQRKWLLEHWNWGGRLVSCPYCLSHWVGGVVVGVYQPLVVVLWTPLDLVVSLFVLVGISAVVIGVVTRLIPFEAEEEVYEALRMAKDTIHKLRGDY